jgi:hypothetical protein
MVNGKNDGRESGNGLFQGVAGCGTGIDEDRDGKRGAATLKDKFTESFGRRGKQNSAN